MWGINGNYKIASCEGRSAGNDHGARVSGLETRTDKFMALLQQIVANQIKEKRARENYQKKRQERERERQKREQERFEVWKETVGEKLVQFSRRIDEVVEELSGSGVKWKWSFC